MTDAPEKGPAPIYTNEPPKYTLEEAKEYFDYQECARRFHRPDKHLRSMYDTIGNYICECGEYRWAPAPETKKPAATWYIDAEGRRFKHKSDGTWWINVFGGFRGGTAEDAGVVFPVTPDPENGLPNG